MTLQELAEMIGTEIQVNYYHNQNRRMAASLKGVEVKDGGMLISKYGDSTGCDPDAAIADYVQRIAGKTVIFDAYGPKRREWKVPATLTA